MSRDGALPARVGRSYTRARRFPWVVGKIQGWQIPFGPYTATQLVVLIGGIWMVVQSYGLWRHLGPAGLLVTALPPAATWAVRHAKIDGRSPVRALGGYLMLLAEPGCGQIAGRTARDARPARMTGLVRLAALPTPELEPSREAVAESAATTPARVAASSGQPPVPSVRGVLAPVLADASSTPSARPAAGALGEGRVAPTALQALLAASAGPTSRR